MSNAENNPRSEDGPEQRPERPQASPDADEDARAHRAEPPQAARPQPPAEETPPSEPHSGSPDDASPDHTLHGPAFHDPVAHDRPFGEHAQPQNPDPLPERATPGGAPGPDPHTDPSTAPHMAAPAGAPGGPAGPPPGHGPQGASRSRRRRGAIAAAVLALALLAGAAGGLVGWFLAGENGQTTVVESVSMDAGAGMTYTEIVDKVTPSVVTIATESAEGSGIVYSEEGHVITNNHVVAGASALEVRFLNGTVAEAEVIATDATQDLALVQVADAEDLQPIAFGDSDSLQVGDAAVAIGSPLGLEGTVTTGIISALNRSMSVGSEERSDQPSGHTLTGLIQTDAAINMGNSGGALVNGGGELIGVNTAILSPESGNVGLGFAIPSNTVEHVIEQLIEHGSVEQGYLGVSVTDTQGNGAMVLAVEAGSPADEAGLQEGDVITEIDGTSVTSASEVVAAVQSKASGDKVGITYTRDGSERTVEVTLTSR